jgi:hypothetical protein
MNLGAIYGMHFPIFNSAEAAVLKSLTLYCLEIKMATMPDVVSSDDTENHPDKVIKVPRLAHMDQQGIDIFSEAIAKSKCYLEYGSGGSTRMAVKAKVPHIFSVESDADYARAVRRSVVNDGKDLFVKIRHGNIGKTKDWGYPVSKESCASWPDYAIAIWDKIEEEKVSPDLIVVDGRFRVACFLTSLLRAKPGTVILFDDYVGREKRYSIVEKYVSPSQLTTRMAVFNVPKRLDVRLIAMELARRCMNPE